MIVFQFFAVLGTFAPVLKKSWNV